MNPQSAFKIALTTWLKAQGSLIALLFDDNIGDCRIYPYRQPQNTVFPELSWWITGGTRYKDMDGPVGISLAKVRFGCRGYVFADADAVADAVRDLDGFLGQMAGMQVLACLVSDHDNGQDDVDPPFAATQAGTAMVSLDAKITYVEPS